MSFVYSLLALLYVVSPFDIIPDIITGLGWLDDLIVLFFLFRYFKQLKSNVGFSLGSSESQDIQKSFNVLGIDPSSNPETIKAAYRKLASQYHPDKVFYKGREYSSEAELRFREIKGAYEQLKRIGRV